MKEAGGSMRHLIRTIVFLIPGTCWAWAAIEPADLEGGEMSWPRLLVGLGVFALIMRRVEGRELTDRYVPLASTLLHRFFWAFVLLEASIRGLYWIGVTHGVGELQWLPVWGAAQILMSVYVSGCKHGASGRPW